MGATSAGQFWEIHREIEGICGSCDIEDASGRTGDVALAVATSAVVVGATGVASAASSSKIPSSAFQDHTGITKTQVKVANVSTLSAGPVQGGHRRCCQAYADYVNSTGGINGRKLVVSDSDDQFSGATNKQATQNAINSDFAMVGNFSLEDSFGGALLKANPGMPDVSVVLDTTTNKLPNVYSAVPLNGGWEEGPLQYFKKKFPNDINARRPDGGRTAFGRDGLGRARSTSWTRSASRSSTNPPYTVSTSRLHPERHRHEEHGGQDPLRRPDGRELRRRRLLKDLDQQNFHPVGHPRCRHLHQHPGSPTPGGPAAVNGAYLEQNTSLYLGQDAKAVPAVATFLNWVQVASPGFKTDLFTLYAWLSAASCSPRP